jgi:mannose/fructose/N-acetylgalactosamine-specific phosphotransferase system component IID
MRRYLSNRWVRIAIGLFVLGSAPLAVLALLSLVMPALAPLMAIGTMLWMLTFWPAVFFLAAGIVQVRGGK